MVFFYRGIPQRIFSQGGEERRGEKAPYHLSARHLDLQRQGRRPSPAGDCTLAALPGFSGRLRATSAAAHRGSATTVRAAQLGAFRPQREARGAGAAADSRRAPRPHRRCASGRTRSCRRSAFSPLWRPSRPTVLLPKAAPTPRSPEVPGPVSRRSPSTTTPKVEREWPDSRVRKAATGKGLPGRGTTSPGLSGRGGREQAEVCRRRRSQAVRGG